MALSKIDVANMLTGATPVANGGTALTSGFKNGVDPRPLSKPIIVNGDCSVAQRGTANTDESASGVYRVDRMNVGLSNIGQFRLSQETLSSGAAYNAGFKKAFRIDCQQADASPASGDIANMTYKLEGNSVQVFKKGTSSAETYTLAFWVKSNKTGTAQVNLVDGDNSRMVSATYTISSADTWEHKVLNYPADTTGALDNDANKSLEIEWALDAGSDFTSGAVPSAWESSANTDRSVNDLALQDNTANDWAITGIQLEVGTFSSTTLPPFQFEDYADNLLRCQRYYVQLGTVGDTQSGFPARAFSSSGLMFAASLAVPLRGDPSTTLVGTIRAFDDAGTKDSTSNFALANYNNTNSNIIMLQSTGFSSLSNDQSYNVMAINDTAYKLDAEL